MPYTKAMYYEFIELPLFQEVRDELFTDESFSDFQWFLCKYPEAGDVIPETKGCRKIRWKIQGKGKQGGIRVIYFLRNEAGQVVLITAYPKSRTEDISRQLLRQIKEQYDGKYER